MDDSDKAAIDYTAQIFAKRMIERVAFFGILGLAGAYIIGWFQPYDDTDSGTDRSGLIIRTDCLTGRQYLADGLGGLTPRIGADGLQIVRQCKKEGA